MERTDISKMPGSERENVSKSQVSENTDAPLEIRRDHLRVIRGRNITHGLMTGLANRVVTIFVSFLSVPLTISYLSPEEYGIWTLLSTILAWLSLADLGVGNGLTNAVAEALGLDRPALARKHISTAVALLTASTVLMAVSITVIWPWINWINVLNLSSEPGRQYIGMAMAVAFSIFLLSFPLSLVPRILNASQHSKTANYWAAGGNLLSLGSLLLTTKMHGGIISLIIAVSGTNLCVQLVCALWLFGYFKPELCPRLGSVARSSVKKVMTVGVQFFVIQILGLTIFQTDTLLIAHFLGASKVPYYTLTFRLFEYASIIQTILFNYIWVGYSEAIARSDIPWVRQTFNRSLISSVGISLILTSVLLFAAQPFITFWTRGVLVPPMDLIAWMGAWSLINSFCSPIACLLAAASQLRMQLVYGSCVAVANILLSVLLIQQWGVSGAIAGTVIAYLIFNCVPTLVDALALIRRLELRVKLGSG